MQTAETGGVVYGSVWRHGGSRVASLLPNAVVLKAGGVFNKEGLMKRYGSWEDEP